MYMSKVIISIFMKSQQKIIYKKNRNWSLLMHQIQQCSILSKIERLGALLNIAFIRNIIENCYIYML